MKRVTIKSISIVLVLFGFICPLALGQDNPIGDEEWEVRLMPYVFFLSLDAEGTIDGLSADADLSFDDIVDNLDFGAMGRLEAWKGKWGLSFDGLFVNLGADQNFRGRRDSVDFSLDNVVYSCGGLIHNGTLVIPYGISDAATGFAVVELEQLLGKLSR